MNLLSIIIITVFCAFASSVIYGMWLVENDSDEFRKKHGYKPKYHDWKENKDDINQDQ